MGGEEIGVEVEVDVNGRRGNGPVENGHEAVVILGVFTVRDAGIANCDVKELEVWYLR